MSEEPHLLTEEVDGILIAILNRPAKLNSITGPMMALLDQAVIRFRDAPHLKVMLIKANGRYFSAGANLKEAGGESMMPDTPSTIREMHRLGLHGMHRIYNEMEAIEKPIVVAHHAPCVGGGLEMSLSCDFRLAAKSAHYSFPEGLFGVLPASNGVSRLTRIVGTHWARWLIMGNQIVPADRALIMGLVHDVYEDDVFEEKVMAFCRHLTGQIGEQMAAAKIAIELCAEVGRDQARNIERMSNAALMLGPDYQQAFSSYVAKIGGGIKTAD